MNEDSETKTEELARLKQELKDLQSTRPEHCYGTKGYVGVHRSTPRHWEEMEDLEDRIQKLEAELTS